MAAFVYLPVPDTTQLFEITHGMVVFGIVWQSGDFWYASPSRGHNDAVAADTRKEAAEALAIALGVLPKAV